MHTKYAIQRSVRRQLLVLKWAVEAAYVTKRHPIMHAFWIAFGVILVWRGIWVIADAYLFPGNPLVSAVVSMAIGTLMLIIDDFRADELRK